ncbi:putative transposase domain protein [Rickettsiales endosymbiont of Paramecium tredecaurelia]|nr:putative transposase domain protein [Candidatus Sarmatiella mevalonica]
MGERFGRSAAGVLYWFRKLGYRCKKTFTHMEASEEKHNTDQEAIKIYH